MTEASTPTARAAGVPSPTPPRSRSRSVTLGSLLLGGLLAIVASSRPWWRASGGEVVVTFSGTEATAGLSQSLAVVTLAGTLLVLVLKVRGRRVLAVLLVAVGLGMALVGALRLRPSGDAVREKIRSVSLVEQYALTNAAWPWVFAVAGLLVVVGAVVLWRGAAHWPARAERFERSSPDLNGTDPLETVRGDPAAAWKALDAGIDPTADRQPSDTPTAGDPDVQFDGTRDTMGAKNAANHQSPDLRARAGEPSRSSE